MGFQILSNLSSAHCDTVFKSSYLDIVKPLWWNRSAYFINNVTLSFCYYGKRQIPEKSTKSSLYRIQAQESAVAAIREALDNFGNASFQPTPLSYQDPDVKGEP